MRSDSPAPDPRSGSTMMLLRRVRLLLTALAAVLLAGASLAAVIAAAAAAPGSAATGHPAHRVNGWIVDRAGAPQDAGREDRDDDAGTLRDDGWRTEPDPDRLRGPSPFLLAHTDARAVVTGPVAHTVLRQEWTNPNHEPLEATYVFPLPDNAAVTAMTLRIGSRRIEAEMRRREEARAIYEQARSEGRVAALLDQERPNVFAQRVANILPGERIDVTIEFDQEVRCDDGDCVYVLPTVVGPRFVPARLADPGRIDPPIARPGGDTGHRLSFTLDLDAGMPVRDLRSPSHRMEIEESRSGRARLRLADEEEARLDRDVEVRFRLGGRDPEFGVLAWRGGVASDRGERGDEPGAFTLFLQPPVPAEAEAAAQPRELIFVLDCSGSMSGEPIEAAKNVVRRALAAARPGDTLQILRFSDRASGLWTRPMPATAANLRRALEYLDTLHGEGGTEMLAGVRAALDRPADPERLRIVAFLTDGYIGNETEILGEVRRLIGEARLFSFGIGSSVNRWLLENLAQEGRGAAAFVGPHEDNEAFVARFVSRIATPVFTDLRLSWEGIEVDDLEPARPPDLFAGQPLVIHGRYREPGAGTLVLEGTLRGRRQVLRRPVTLPAYAADHEALGRLWARARIDRLTRESYGRPDPDTVEAVTRLGLRFRLMTPYTSLVAVDSVVSSRGGETNSVDVPVELPEGVDPALAGAAPILTQASRFGARVQAETFSTASPKVMEERLETLNAPAPQGATAPPASQSELPRMAPLEAATLGDSKPSTRPPDTKDTAPVSFVLVRVVEEDGTQRTVEADGEAWLFARLRRTLVRTLTSADLRGLREALAAAGAGRWPNGDATFARGRGRLVVVLEDGSTRSLGLDALDGMEQRIVALIRTATDDEAVSSGGF